MCHAADHLTHLRDFRLTNKAALDDPECEHAQDDGGKFETSSKKWKYCDGRNPPEIFRSRMRPLHIHIQPRSADLNSYTVCGTQQT